MGIAAEIRYKRILEKLNSIGRVYVKDLAKKFKVTEVTSRRDLAALEKTGPVEKSLWWSRTGKS